MITPHPHKHAILAGKRDLTLLSDEASLEELAIQPAARPALAALPKTVLVTYNNADKLCCARPHLFFKPTRSHGIGAIYRGDKVSRGVLREILRGDYVAQDFAAPSERMFQIDGQRERRKMDERLHKYGGTMLIAAARLYEGQTTYFRTTGGGFSPVFAV